MKNQHSRVSNLGSIIEENTSSTSYVGQSNMDKETSSSKVVYNMDSDIESNLDDSILEGWDDESAPESTQESTQSTPIKSRVPLAHIQEQ